MRIVAAIAIGLMLVGCRGRGHSATPDGREFPHVTDAIDRHAPTLDQVGALTFNGTDVGAVTLSGGVWERAATTGDPDFARIEVIRDVFITGDLDASGTDEAVALLELRRADVESRIYAAVVDSSGGHLANVATVPIGDRIQVRSGRIENGRLVLEVVQRPPATAPSDLPGESVTLTYEFSDGRLRTVASRPEPAAAAGRVALAGTSWKLTEFQSMDDTTLRPEADATFEVGFDDDGRLRVRADCNRGTASWRSAAGASLEIGPLALTRALCPSALHDRFVRDLPAVRSYVVRDGRLYLGLKADAGIYGFEPVDYNEVL